MKQYRLCLAVAGVAALAGCGGARSGPSAAAVELHIDRAPVALRAAPLLFPGEVLRFDLSLRGVVGGEALIAVGQPGVIDGRTVVIARSRTETVGLVAAIKKVRDEVVTHIELGTGLPVYHQADVVFGDREAVIETRFAGNHADVAYQRKGMRQRKARIEAPTGDIVYEAHSVVGALRGWAPSDGERAYFYILSGRRLWRNDVVAVERADIRTALGSFRAVRVDGVAERLLPNLRPDPGKKPRQFSVWISEDPERRPLRVVGKTEYGDVQAELVEHEIPGSVVAGR